MQSPYQDRIDPLTFSLLNSSALPAELLLLAGFAELIITAISLTLQAQVFLHEFNELGIGPLRLLHKD
jgi:hypothetical protein